MSPEVHVPDFDRSFFASGRPWSRIGGGSLGGKAGGLLRSGRLLREEMGASAAGLAVSIPVFVALGTDVFRAFVERNDLHAVAASGAPDHRISHAFQQGDLPTEVLGDLRGLVEGVRTPLAVRSSSLLEDALAHPFAGVYETKMIPNNQPTADARFRRLVEAVKLVWASTFHEAARGYRRALDVDEGEEAMAVVIQEVVGRHFGDRYYPHVSVVARSFNYYPLGPARPEDGVVSLALGLGKTIVDGGRCWSYSPRHPKAPPPFASAREMLHATQSSFWAVNMGRPPAFDPLAETEYMVEGDLAHAEYDGTLSLLASTWDPDSDRLRPGTGRDGPRVLDFALLREGEVPLNAAVVELLERCEGLLGGDVEIELALALPGAGRSPREELQDRAHLGLVQLRPMSSPREQVEIEADELTGPGVLMASRQAMGNGRVEGIRDVVYVKPGPFEAAATREIAREVDAWNRRLVEAGRPYLLVGFGRWGSSDPWLGIPVRWGQVAGARVLVESVHPAMNVEPSQGTHFFHNLTSLGATYLAVGPGAPTPVRWAWLDAREAVAETLHLRHVRVPEALDVRVDGRRSLGVVRVRGEDG